MLNFLLWRFARDVGIDLGTANTLVFLKGHGIILQEPTVVALDRETEEIIAIGNEAKSMVGRTPGNIVAVKPMADGVIADFDVTEKMLHYFIDKARRQAGFFAPRAVVGVPSGVTEVEKRAVMDAAREAGAREVFIIEEPMAAAIGAGLPIQEPTGNLIVDIGGGTTEVAVISLGGIVTSRSIRVAGNEMNAAITQYIKKNYNLMIGEQTSEEIKKTTGSAYPQNTNQSIEVKGRDLVSGLPKVISLSSHEVMEALTEPVEAIIEAVKLTLEKTPPELAADILDRGIVMTGGGALLRGLDRLMAEETSMPVQVAEDPLTCMARGTGIALETLNIIGKSLLSNRQVS